MNRTQTIGKSAVRDAATVIVLRDTDTDPHILMGQRGANAAFMPNKFVFPGGAVDALDAEIPLASPLPEKCYARICEDADPKLAQALAIAAIRELWEETGLVLGVPGTWSGNLPDDWVSFAKTHHLPHAEPLEFVFRALTPPGRPRRFDARFFLVNAEYIASDLDDFSAASDELSHLQWVSLSNARAFDMPFITEVVLSEIQARISNSAPPKGVPFFKNTDEASLFKRLYGREISE